MSRECVCLAQPPFESRYCSLAAMVALSVVRDRETRMVLRISLAARRYSGCRVGRPRVLLGLVPTQVPEISISRGQGISIGLDGGKGRRRNHRLYVIEVPRCRASTVRTGKLPCLTHLDTSVDPPAPLAHTSLAQELFSVKQNPGLVILRREGEKGGNLPSGLLLPVPHWRPVAVHSLKRQLQSGR